MPLHRADSLCSRCNLARASMGTMATNVVEQSNVDSGATTSEALMPDRIAEDANIDRMASASRWTPIYLAVSILVMIFLAILVSRISKSLFFQSRNSQRIVISTEVGQITGTIVDGTFEFLKVPFARPLTKTDRFKSAMPITENSSRYVRDSKWACMQMVDIPYGNVAPKNDTGENCLHLSIWSPAHYGEGPPLNKPVLVYLHGGFFTIGFNDQALGRKMAAQGDLVVVAPNYRLDVFGFLRSDGREIPGNLGLRDQLLALTFVRRNIVHFGGDPNRIALAGHDAGAASLGFHLFRKDNFWNNSAKRLVLMGGSPINGLLDCSVAAMRKLAHLAAVAHCRKSAINVVFPLREVVCLRGLEAKALLEFIRGGFQNLPAFLPTYGDDVLLDHPVNLIERKGFTGKAFLIGTVFTDANNMHDLTWSIISRVENNRTRLLKRVNYKVDNETEESYRNQCSGCSAHSWLDHLVADVLLFCPMLYFAEVLAEWGNRVYMYLFKHRPDSEPHQGRLLYSDERFLFGLGRMTPAEGDFSDNIRRIWTTFIREGVMPAVHGQPWPEFSSQNPSAVELTVDKLSVVRSFRWGRCNTIKAKLLKGLKQQVSSCSRTKG